MKNFLRKKMCFLENQESYVMKMNFEHLKTKKTFVKQIFEPENYYEIVQKKMENLGRKKENLYPVDK